MTEKGWNKLRKNLTSEAEIKILPVVKKKLRDEGPEPVDLLAGPFVAGSTGGATGKDAVYFAKVFYGFIEIDSSMNTLRDIERYLSSFPYRSKSVSKVRHLRYTIENYLNEVYLLKERQKAYLTVIGRCYRGDPRQGAMLRTTRPLFTLMSEGLKNVVATRGAHVHQRRYSDADLDRSSS